MISSLVMVAALALGAEGAADAKNYTLDLSGTTKQVAAGKKGTMKLHIKPSEGFKVSAEAPLKINLESAGLQLAKKQLGHDDKQDKKSTSPEFSVPFGAGAAGEQSIVVDATFFVCNEKLCERKTEKVTVPVVVSP